MTPEDIKDRAQKGKTIRHPKTPDVAYVILGIGKMKSGGVWLESCTYMNVKTKESFTRATDDMKKFFVKEK